MSYIHPVPLQFRDIHRQQGNTHQSSHRHHHSHRRTAAAADSPLGLVKSEEAPVGDASEDEDEGETHHQTVSGQQLEIAQESRSGKTTDITVTIQDMQVIRTYYFYPNSNGTYTGLPAYSDRAGTMKKCQCKRVSLYPMIFDPFLNQKAKLPLYPE